MRKEKIFELRTKKGRQKFFLENEKFIRKI